MPPMKPNPYIAGGAEADLDSTRRFDWREGVAILIERFWLGLFVAVIVFLLFFFQARRQIPYYRSTATLMVEAQIPKILNYQDLMAYNIRNLEYFNTHLNALHSRSMLAEALRQSGLADRDSFLPGLSVEAKMDRIRGWVTITAIEKSRMINITVEHSDPQIASDLANALAGAYIQQDLDNRMGASMQAIDWLHERSEEYRQKLEKGFHELQEYREQTGSVSLEDDQNIVIEKLKALNSALTVAQTERIRAETNWKNVQQQLQSGVPAVQIASLLSVGEVEQARQRLQEKNREIANLRQRYREQHPDLQQALESEQKLANQLEQACSNAVYALERQYKVLVEHERHLQEALAEQEQEAFELDRKLVRYNELKRNIDTDQEIHRAVLARMKEASISESLPTDIIRLVEEARPAKIPFRPRMGQALARGALFGGILGLGAIFLFYYADHRFRRSEEIERILGLPVLATVPLILDKTDSERGQVAELKSSGEIAEAFRTLRASLLLKGEILQAPVVMVTSAGPSEGKSLIASNLAISLARDGRRTLLIGGDLRRPSLSKIFGIPSQAPGLAEALKGHMYWRDTVQATATPHLDALPAGRLPSHPSELLGRKILADIFNGAKEIYKHVIVDAPPILGVSDSLVLLPDVDGVLFVVRYGVTHSLGASHAMVKLRDSGTPCLGIVLNGVNLSSFANYYYYRRYGGYGYQAYQARPTVMSVPEEA